MRAAMGPTELGTDGMDSQGGLSLKAPPAPADTVYVDGSPSDPDKGMRVANDIRAFHGMPPHGVALHIEQILNGMTVVGKRN